MTPTEERRQRVELRIDLEEAEHSLAQLNECAIRRAEELNSVAKKLQKNAHIAPSGEDFDPATEFGMRLTPEEFGMLKVSGDGITRLIAEMLEQRQRVFHLRERDSNLSRYR